ncbi:hypothetical protein [Hyphomonas pacifica]|uniref:Lipoprotein n=1 Tax=Hyphomonas pacifica TaxID=1280941 RepID=A0A062U5U3_9PROT|nr:hypothetical protein [Hyphomonas pacifica]KCZ51530.1 hypothetical protein HY2_11005 [Hyphomonas pacifica]RAN34130.1 hypothetical protein HY3_11235 [Hyphomonas pacifica]
MIRSGLVFAASALVLAACSTAPSTTDSAATPAVTQPVDEFALAMQTVNQLVDAGNTQTAIDRLTQLAGDPDLSQEELAETLLRRGELRFSEQGYDLMGAISDFEEIINDLPQTEAYSAAVPMLDIARGKATSLNTLLVQPETTRQEKFNILMELGQHQEAIDLMIQSNLTPDNDTLVAMYQIGYLCEGDELTGREYDAIEPDGTERTLRFCDFGK